MKKLLVSKILFVAIICLFSCKKKNTHVTPKEIDTAEIIGKMVGLHKWTGTIYTRYEIGGGVYADSTKQINFDCPIKMIDKTHIYFDSASTSVLKNMYLIRMDPIRQEATFESYTFYHEPPKSDYEGDSLVYNFQANTFWFAARRLTYTDLQIIKNFHSPQ